MLFKHKKPNFDHLTLEVLLSNSFLSYSLSSMKWKSSVRGLREIEISKITSIHDSILTQAVLTKLLPERFQLDNFMYERNGNLLEKTDLTVKPRKKEKKMFKISSPFKVKVDIDKDPGVVLSVK